jgi:hypothetical protein
MLGGAIEKGRGGDQGRVADSVEGDDAASGENQHQREGQTPAYD